MSTTSRSPRPPTTTAKVAAILGIGVGVTGIGAAAQAGASTASDLAAARATAATFHRVSVAEGAGYGLPPAGPVHECIANLNGTGAMGLHWINGTYAGDTELDPAKPEALVYEPRANGRLRLVALEYIVSAAAWDGEHSEPPELFGRQLKLIGAPNRYEVPPFYEVHVWIGKHNPHGMFMDHNPRVSCANA